MGKLKKKSRELSRTSPDRNGNLLPSDPRFMDGQLARKMIDHAREHLEEMNGKLKDSKQPPKLILYYKAIRLFMASSYLLENARSLSDLSEVIGFPKYNWQSVMLYAVIVRAHLRDLDETIGNDLNSIWKSHFDEADTNQIFQFGPVIGRSGLEVAIKLSWKLDAQIRDASFLTWNSEMVEGGFWPGSDKKLTCKAFLTFYDHLRSFLNPKGKGPHEFPDAEKWGYVELRNDSERMNIQLSKELKAIKRNAIPATVIKVDPRDVCPVKCISPNVIECSGATIEITPAQWPVVDALARSWPTRLLLKELVEKSGKPDAHKHLKNLIKKHPELKSIISTPKGVKGAGFGIVV